MTTPLGLSVSLPGHVALIDVMPSTESCMQFGTTGPTTTVRVDAPRPSPGARRVLRSLCRGCLAVLALGAPGSTAAGEEPLALPTLPGYQRASTFDLNNRGQVVGAAFAGEPGEPLLQAVLWRWRPWRPATVQPLPIPAEMENSEATAISRSGIPVGFSFLSSGSFRALVWQRGPGGDWDAVELEPPPGFTDALAAGVNSRGEIVGWAGNAGEVVGVDAVQRAVLWKRGRDGAYSVSELETPDGFQSRGAAINERGDVVGTAFRTEFEDGRRVLRSEILVWRRTLGRSGSCHRSPVVLTPLPGLPTNQDPAISLSGDVVATAAGTIGGVPTTRPLLWKWNRSKKHHWPKHSRQYGDPIELPVPEGFASASARDINAFGRVAGTVLVQEGATTLSTRGVVWSRRRDGGWTVEELDSPEGVAFVSTIRLNDLGWIAGRGTPPSAGESGALLWIPPRKPCMWKRP